MAMKKCQKATKVSNIKVEERSIKAVFANPENLNHIITQNDNCVMLDPLPRADYVITKKNVGDLVVELKGKDVEHALHQVRSTIDYWREHHYFTQPKTAALIVCRQHPTVVAAVKAITAFRSTYPKQKLTVTTHCANKKLDDYFI